MIAKEGLISLKITEVCERVWELFEENSWMGFDIIAL